MAIMIPKQPKHVEKNSKEDIVFELLQHGLSDNYTVFHSYNPVVTSENVFYDREIDFVITHKDKGILCLEVKAGARIQCINREWYYSSGKKMDHDGPYNQVASAKRCIVDKIKSHANIKVQALYDKCRFFYAVMFIDVTRDYFQSLQGLPENADPRITICTDDLKNIQSTIDSIFDLELSYESQTKKRAPLSESDYNLLLNSVLCPIFHVVPSPKSNFDFTEVQMNMLLREQYVLLDFLSEQKIAVINGAAGTGKTMIAVEKAARHSETNEKVLFLCYNKFLCESLNSRYKKSKDKRISSRYDNVDFMTISKLAKDKTGNFEDYDGLLSWILDCIDKKDDFGYRHIVIDEGQDFGLIDSLLSEEGGSSEENCSIIDALQELAVSLDGTFFLFYDKYQMIQGGAKKHYKLPDCIENCDCRLTLHTNCRNTKEIARTSVTPLRDIKNRPVKPLASLDGKKPTMYFVENGDEARYKLNSIIDSFVNDGFKDIVILSQKNLDFSCVANFLSTGKDGFDRYTYKQVSYPVTTCIKFKGLEADAVIVIDLDKDSFSDFKGLLFYQASSRAKLMLSLICNVSDEHYSDVLLSLDPDAPSKKTPERMRKMIADLFDATIC